MIFRLWITVLLSTTTREILKDAFNHIFCKAYSVSRNTLTQKCCIKKASENIVRFHTGFTDFASFEPAAVHGRFLIGQNIDVDHVLLKIEILTLQNAIQMMSSACSEKKDELWKLMLERCPNIWRCALYNTCYCSDTQNGTYLSGLCGMSIFYLMLRGVVGVLAMSLHPMFCFCFLQLAAEGPSAGSGSCCHLCKWKSKSCVWKWLDTPAPRSTNTGIMESLKNPNAHRKAPESWFNVKKFAHRDFPQRQMWLTV